VQAEESEEDAEAGPYFQEKDDEREGGAEEKEPDPEGVPPIEAADREDQGHGKEQADELPADREFLFADVADAGLIMVGWGHHGYRTGNKTVYK
jgi:hypothetical protein